MNGLTTINADTITTNDLSISGSLSCGNLNVSNTALFTNHTPQTPITPTNSNDLTNKNYVDVSISSITTNILNSNNTWTNQNTFNNYTPQTPITPATNNDLTNKQYVDSSIESETTNLLNSDNTWNGLNRFNNDLTCDIVNIETLNVNNIISNNINTGQIQATSGTINNLFSTTATIDTLNGKIGSFINNSSSVLVETQMSYSGGILYHNYNPITLQATSGWTYILYTTVGVVNKQLIYNGLDNFNIYYCVIGGAGGGAGGSGRYTLASNASTATTTGGSGGGGSSGQIINQNTALTMSSGKYFNIVGIGAGGLGGVAGKGGPNAQSAGAGSGGGTTTLYNSINGATSVATGGIGGYVSNDALNGGMGGDYFTVGSSPSTQYYGYGGGRVSGTTSHYTGGFNTTTSRSGGYGGYYCTNNITDTIFYNYPLDINAALGDGTN